MTDGAHQTAPAARGAVQSELTMLAMNWSFTREKPFLGEVHIGAGMSGVWYVGCAGWNVPRDLQSRFPAEGSHLERYASVLPATEINSSFYRPHRAATYARWRDSVPDGFRFSVKLARDITHRLRLNAAEAELADFLEPVLHLREKLGCILVQLPPGLQYDPLTAGRFFNCMRSLTEADIACEPRHASWGSAEVDDLMENLGIARVMADPPVVDAQPRHGGLVYMRLHGSPVIYRSPYGEHALDRISKELAFHKRMGRRVWCVFDNTASGAAVPDALAVLARLHGSLAPPDEQMATRAN